MLPLRAFTTVLICYSVLSPLLIYPHHLAYFNDFVGGPRNGDKHLLGSSFDWGQGISEAVAWLREHEPNSAIQFKMHSATLAKVLMDQRSPVPVATIQRPTGKPRLIVYSADRFSDRKHSSALSTATEVDEKIIKRFPSGIVVVCIYE